MSPPPDDLPPLSPLPEDGKVNEFHVKVPEGLDPIESVPDCLRFGPCLVDEDRGTYRIIPIVGRPHGELGVAVLELCLIAARVCCPSHAQQVGWSVQDKVNAKLAAAGMGSLHMIGCIAHRLHGEEEQRALQSAPGPLPPMP